MPRSIQISRSSLDWRLLCLLFIAVLINLPTLLGYVLPTRDTMYMFQTFYFFYNDFFIHGDIPRWLPFGLYGIQSDNSLIAILSPSSYFTGLLGYAAGIKNILLLFQLSLLIEQTILLTGVYLLAGRLFRHRGTVFIVSLTVLCGTVLQVQYLLNFHIYSTLPLLIYLLIRAFDTYSSSYFVLFMTAFVISLFGNPPYFIPIPLIAVLIVSAALLVPSAKDLRRFLKPSRSEILISAVLFLLFIAAAGLYYLFITNAMSHTEGIYIGRDPVSLKTDLGTFLNYANDDGFRKFKGLVWPSEFFILDDLTLHIGLITLVFAVAGVLFGRHPLSFAFTACVLFFGVFSLGGKTPVAEFFFRHFPMMDYFRHIRDVVSNYKLFIPFLAGFGLERLFDAIENGGNERRFIAFAAQAAASIAVIAGSIVYSNIYRPELTVPAAAITIVFLSAVFFLNRGGLLRNTIRFLTACFIFQMISYQALANSTLYRVAQAVQPFDKDAVSVYEYPYQEMRTQSPYSKRAFDAMAFTNVTKINYSFVYNFLLWDPCVSGKRVDFLNRDVFDYLALKGAGFPFINPRNNTFGKRLSLPDDPFLLDSIGCNSGKLKLYKDVIFSGSIEETREAIRNTPEINRVIVLNGVDEKNRAAWISAGPPADGRVNGAVSVKGFSANRLGLEVDIREEGGAWLYYADAFHPGWKAYVNGEARPIARANMAFKALFLSHGRNSVEFIFENEPARTMGRLIILLCIISTTVMLAVTFKMCLLKGKGAGTSHQP